ncbi:MAG: hypothetical protein ACRDTS_21470 [Mycobacterium sp.]
MMVDAVIPMSEAGTVPVGAAAGEVDEVDGAVVAADVEDDVEEAGADVLLLEELHPAASRTAADSAITTPATRARLCTRRPVPRPGDSLLGLIAMPSTTSLPVRFGPATPALLRPWPRERYTERSVKKQRRIDPADDCAGICYASAVCKRLQHHAGM